MRRVGRDAETGERAARQLGLIWGAVAVALVLASPLGAGWAAGLPACPIQTLAGLPCPGCGTTRSALALGRLDVAAALAASPLATLAWIGLVVGGVVAGAAALLGRPFREPSWDWPLSARLGVCVVIAVNWLYLLWAGT